VTYDRRIPLFALAAAGVLWGTTVPLSKVALEWLDPAWLTVARLGLSAPLLLLAARRTVRAAATPSIALWGALGFGVVIVLQNLGIARTSVSHAALIVGAGPVFIALMAAALGRGVTGPLAWTGFTVALAGVALVAGGGGGEATLAGDALVLLSLVLSAAYIVAQPRLLAGRDPAAVTAVQLAAGAASALPLALAFEPLPADVPGAGTAAATIGLALAGTLLAFALFAYGQAHVPAEVAGAFLNLEPVVGALAGTVAFGDPFGPVQVAGAAAILAGIALSALPAGGADGRGRWTGRLGRAPSRRDEVCLSSG
jgi:drug/metabolite transporter (DMT)-like permease